MEVSFENQYTKTEDFYSEYFKQVHLKNRLNIFFCIFYLINIIFNLLTVIFFEGDSKLLLILVVVFVFLCFIKVLVYKSETQSHYKRDLAFTGGEPLEIYLTVTESGLDYCVINYQTKTHFDFSQIKKVKKMENYIVVLLKSTYPFIFKKDSFTKGNPDEFLDFLKGEKVR